MHIMMSKKGKIKATSKKFKEKYLYLCGKTDKISLKSETRANPSTTNIYIYIKINSKHYINYNRFTQFYFIPRLSRV